MADKKAKQDLQQLTQDLFDGKITEEQYNNVIMSDPEMAKRFKTLSVLGDPYIAQLKQQYGSVFDSLINGIGSIVGASQYKYGKRKLDQLKQPVIPNASKLNPLLQQAISKANQYFVSPQSSGILAPYQQGISEAYNAGIKQAQTASGGQSGLYGAAGQSLYNQRLKQSAQLPGILAQAQAGYGTQLGNLLNVQQQGQQRNDLYNLQKAGMNLDQYNLNRQSYSALSNTGQRNFYAGLAGQKGLITDVLVPRLLQGHQTGNSTLDNMDKENATEAASRYLVPQELRYSSTEPISNAYPPNAIQANPFYYTTNDNTNNNLWQQ